MKNLARGVLRVLDTFLRIFGVIRYGRITSKVLDEKRKTREETTKILEKEFDKQIANLIYEYEMKITELEKENIHAEHAHRVQIAAIRRSNTIHEKNSKIIKAERQLNKEFASDIVDDLYRIIGEIAPAFQKTVGKCQDYLRIAENKLPKKDMKIKKNQYKAKKFDRNVIELQSKQKNRMTPVYEEISAQNV